jgi:hypothetical protein
VNAARTFAALWLAGVCLVRAAPHAAAADEAFTVAVMRRDGIVIPFAAHDGRRWSSSWPPPRFDLQIPVALDGVPKSWWGPARAAADWQVWPAVTAAAPRTAHVTQPDWIDAHCVRQVGLKTDYRSDRPVPPLTEQPYPKDGLAVAPPQPLLPIEIVPPGIAARILAAAGFADRFNKAERVTALGFGHPINQRARESAEPLVEAVYAFGDNPRAYYVEASRSYRKVADGGCTIIAFATGWLIESGGRTRWGDVAVDLLPCSKYGATYMLPFGAMRIGARTYWLAQYSGWDHERYVIVELKKDRVDAAVNVWGGGC